MWTGLYTSLIKHKGFEKHLRALAKNCRDILLLKPSHWMGTPHPCQLSVCRNEKNICKKCRGTDRQTVLNFFDLYAIKFKGTVSLQERKERKALWVLLGVLGSRATKDSSGRRATRLHYQGNPPLSKCLGRAAPLGSSLGRISRPCSSTPSKCSM